MSNEQIDFTKNDNYSDKKTQTGISHERNKRETQEDTYVTGNIKSRELNDNHWNTVLNSTINHLQTESTKIKSSKASLSSIGEIQGSTACVAIYENNKVHVSNLGDSLAFLVTIDENEKANCQQLNEIHSKENEQKGRTVNEFGKSLQFSSLNNNRLKSGLNVLRSIGDTKHENYGLSHKPDNTHYSINFDNKKRHFLIISCDGLTEGNVVNEKDIQNTVLGAKDKSTEEIAKTLVNQAIDSGSRDNITV